MSSDAQILLNGITGTAEVPAVGVRQLQAGDLTISDSLFPVVWAPLMAGADGILGLAGVDSPNLLVDFEHQEVVIARSGGGGAGDMMRSVGGAAGRMTH